MMESLAIIVIAFGLQHHVVAQADLPVSCVPRSCEKIGYGECELMGEYWAVYNHLGRKICVCCKGERDAAATVGLHGHKTNGLFYGDRYKMCETVYIDQVSCYSRQTRDCNYNTMVYRNKFVGCFYCRPRCETDVQCHDIERVCGKCREDQPVPACTEPIFARIAREMKPGSDLTTEADFVTQTTASTDHDQARTGDEAEASSSADRSDTPASGLGSSDGATE